VANRISRFEQSSALNHHHRALPTHVQPGRDLPCLAFAADADDPRRAAPLDRVLPLSDRAVWNSYDVGDAERFKKLRDLLSGEHSVDPQFAFDELAACTRCSMKNSIIRCELSAE